MTKKKEEFDLSKLKIVDGKYVLPLSRPIQFGETKITEFHLDEPRAKHLRDFPANPKMDDILKVVGSLAQQPDSVIDELSMKDTNSCTEFFSAFD